MTQKIAAGRGLVTLVLGGVRSGKSRYAEALIARSPKPWVYVATAEARDDEMAERIAAHKARRAEGWQTIEAPHDLADAVKQAPADAAVLVDCLTLWLSNLMEGSFDIDAETARLQEALAGTGRLNRSRVERGRLKHRAGQCARPSLSRSARRAQSEDGGASRARRDDGCRHRNRGEKPMTKPVDDKDAERHRAKMAKRKAVQDEEVAGKQVEKGLLIVHTGTGKGKSTAAFGLALRMLGRGKRVGVVQFIKGAWHSAERDALEKFGDQVSWHSMGEGFTWETQDLARDIAAATRAFDKAQELMADPSFALVILDELNIALRYDYLPLDQVDRHAESAPSRSACDRHRAEREAAL